MPESPGTPDSAAPASGGSATRRRFLAGAGAGLAVTAAGVVATTEASAAPPQQALPEQAGVADAVAAGVPMVVYITDNKHNRVSIQRGAHEVVVQDGHLVQALNRAYDRRRPTSKEC